MNRSMMFAFFGILIGITGSAMMLYGPWDQVLPHSTAQVLSVNASQEIATEPIDYHPQGSYTPEEKANIFVYQQANRSVVNINTQTVEHDSFFFMEQQALGSGSGSVLDKNGHILTNFHVVDGAEQIEVTLANGETHQANVVGFDRTDDIAVLKIDAPANTLFPIQWGDSSQLKVGQKAYAIGNPFGWDRTLTTGIVSSLNRSLPSRSPNRAMKSLIQTDAAMNPGNSGGPLLNSHAEVIGMNVAIATKTGQNTGIGFAIPANRIKRVVPELIRDGKITRTTIGIASVGETSRGLIVVKVIPGGPAEKAGIQGFKNVVRRYRQGGVVYEERRVDRSTADTIVSVDNNKIESAEKFIEMIEEKRPGDTVTLKVIRGNKAMDILVELGAS